MINDDDATTRRALANCDLVRAVRVQFLQVRPDPACADNVCVRMRKGVWHRLHVINAVALAKLYKLKQRSARKSRAAASMGRGDATGVRLPRR